MDWKSLGPIIGAIAPVAGSILGGLIPFPGGSMIGEQFGKIIARQFSVAPTPEAVAGAIAGSPNEVVLAKIAAATEEAKATIAGFAAMERDAQESVRESLKQTGQTMRAEGEQRARLLLAGIKEHWFYSAGRPMIMWEFIFFAGVFGLLLSVAGFNAVFLSDDRGIKIIEEVWKPFAAFFVVLAALCGVYIPSRSKEQTAAINAGVLPGRLTPAPPPPAPAPKPAPKPPPKPVTNP